MNCTRHYCNNCGNCRIASTYSHNLETIIYEIEEKKPKYKPWFYYVEQKEYTILNLLREYTPKIPKLNIIATTNYIRAPCLFDLC